MDSFSLGCFCGFLKASLVELTSTQAVRLLLLAATIHQFPFTFYLWGPLTFRLNDGRWVEPVLRRPRLAFLEPRVHIPSTPPSTPGSRGWTVTFPDTAFCSPTLGLLSNPLTFWFLRQKSHTSPQTLGDPCQAFQTLPLRPFTLDLK